MENKDLAMQALNDDELNGVTGGMSNHQYMDIMCSCGHINKVDISKSEYSCSKCSKKNRIDG